jgi:DNA-binding winged helix-turn-helix (wHTH) protein/Tol biopolymer transport system component
MTGDRPVSPRDKLPAWKSVHVLRVGDVEVRPSSNEIVGADGLVRLKPRLMDVLLRLAFEPGAVVTRQTLLEEVWPRRMVNDDVLSRAIADLRVALHDDARESRFIETLPKLGYRLVAPVVRMPPALSVEGMAAAPRERPVRRLWPVLAALAVAGSVAAWIVLRPATVPTWGRAALEQQLAGAEPFSSEPGVEVAPRFSADGNQVAYALGDGDRSRIVIRDLTTRRQRLFGDPAALNHSPVFFPDGARIAYFRRDTVGCAIVELDLASGAERALLGCPRNLQPRFDLASDGQHLAYAAESRPQFPVGLFVRDLATGTDRALTAPEPGMGDDLFPRFSPDGRRVAFFRGSESHRQLWLVEVDNPEGARSAGSPRGLSYGAAWLDRDGPLIVASDWFGFRALNLFDPRTTEAATLGGRGARFPDVDRRGNLVFENAQYQANLYELNLADPASTPGVLWPSTRYTNQPEFAPDGQRLAFVSNRDGAPGIFVGNTGAGARRLPLSEDYQYQRPHWSHDGSAIYAVRVQRRPGAADAQQGIRITLPDDRVEVLHELGNALVDVRETADGEGLIAGEIAGNAVRILRARRSTPAAPERLPLPLVSEYQVRGDRLAFTQPQLPGFMLCSLASLACAPVAMPATESPAAGWLLAPDALFVLGEGGGVNALLRYDLGTHKASGRRALPPTGLGLSATLSPDGRRLVFAREEELRIDLLFARRPLPP